MVNEIDFVPDDESQFIFAHQVEELGVDVHDVGMPSILRSDGESIDG